MAIPAPIRTCLALVLVFSSHVFAQSQEITGTGATFPAKVYAQWVADHVKETGQPLSYKPAGSSAGVKAVVARSVDFGATDVPLSQTELDRQGLFQFPTLVGGIVPFVNLPGVRHGDLRLDAATLARIWSADIKRWNDPAILALNPALTLPDLPIRRVVRADGSGTTTVFVEYLRSAAPGQAATIVPDGGRAKWPGSTVAVDGSGKVVADVMSHSGSMGYVSSDYVLRDGLSGVSLKTVKNEYVRPTVASFRAAIVAAGLFKDSLQPASLLNVAGAGVWPIVTATYVLVPNEPASPERASRTLHFFYQSFLKGDRAVAGSGFAPLPIATQARIVGLLSNFKTPSGQRIHVIGSLGPQTAVALN